MQKFTGMQYLKIDIANNFGLDKKTWNERLEWFDNHEDRLMQMLALAEEPALFYAGVQALEAAKRGEPSGYPISLDATSSGLQILAALTGDRKAAEICNVVKYIRDAGPLDFSEEAEAERRDGYTVVYQAMLQVIGENGRIKRDDVKRAVMTSLYGSQAVPKEVFGEGVLLHVFYQVMKELAPAAWELNEAFLDMWDDEALINSWVLPDNFHVHVKVIDRVLETVHFMNEPFETFYNVNAPVSNGRSLGANTIHSIDGMLVREMTRRCNYDANKVSRLYDNIEFALNDDIIAHDTDEDSKLVKILWQHYLDSGFLSARIIDCLHAHNLHLVDLNVIKDLLDSLPEKSFQVISVHDCFRCLPNYGNDLRRQYNLLLMNIAKSNLLSFLLSQIIHRPVSIGKLDPDMWKDIEHTEYALS